MLDIRRREEAEGESRIMGSGRREGFLWCEAMEGWVEGAVEEGADGRVDEGGGAARERARKISADLRMCEKSWGGVLSVGSERGVSEMGRGRGRGNYGWFDASEDAVSVAHSSLAVVDLLEPWIDGFSCTRSCGAAGYG